MKIKSNKKKERFTFLIIGIGVVVVLVVWGFQLNMMFTEMNNSKTSNDVEVVHNSINEAFELTEQLRKTLPFLNLSFSETVAQSKELLVGEAPDNVSSDVLSNIGDKLNNELDRQNNEQNNTDEETRGETIDSDSGLGN